jgi:ferredoxin
MKITVDRDRCIGVGQCVMSDPDIFDQDEDGLVVLLAEQADDPELVRQAIRRCPTQALGLCE